MFVTPGMASPPSSLQPTSLPALTLVPPTVQPAFSTLCTIATVGLYLRNAPSSGAPDLELLPVRSEVQWTGAEAQADGRTWYEIVTAEGLQGWAASEWLYQGACSEVPPSILAPLIIEQACISGHNWAADHFALDLHSLAGHSTIYAPYSGTVVASDTCPACTAGGNADGDRPGSRDNPDYNLGYGAMVIVEYPYSELTQEERDALLEDGIILGPGESLYMMIAHLDPQQPIAAGGAVLSAGEALATIGTSGNSTGPHAHVEVAINASGLRPDGDTIYDSWLYSVAEKPIGGGQGHRVDPSPLFDMPESCWGE